MTSPFSKNIPSLFSFEILALVHGAIIEAKLKEVKFHRVASVVVNLVK